MYLGGPGRDAKVDGGSCLHLELLFLFFCRSRWGIRAEKHVECWGIKTQALGGGSGVFRPWSFPSICSKESKVPSNGRFGMDCWTSVGSPEDWSQEHLCMTSTEAMDLSAESASSRVACREALATDFPSATRAENSCLDSWGSKFLNFNIKSQTFKSYVPSNA